jgi:hypothetical protein
MDKSILYRQIDDQATLIEDLKETIVNQRKVIESQNAALREVGFMSAHCFNGRLKTILKPEDTRMGMN